MPERLHPGVYNEERRSGIAPIQGVSTSTMGIVGFTYKGRVNEAVLSTSYTQFRDQHGNFIAKSSIPIHVFAFFSQGGRRAYVVRVVGAGALKASGAIQSKASDVVLATANGILLIFSGVSLAKLPVRPGSFSFVYNEIGAVIAAEACNLSPVPNAVATSFVGKLASPPVPGTVVITDADSGGGPPVPQTYSDPAKDGVLKDGAAVTRGFIDYATGQFVLTTAVAPAAPAIPGDVTYAYTAVGTQRTVTDDGLTVLTGPSVTVGTINYTTGAWSVTVTAAPHDQSRLLASYDIECWPVTALDEGVCGNDVRVDVRGNENYFDRATATYSAFDMLIYEADEDGVYQLVETFDELDFSSASAARYAPALLNNDSGGSAFITMTDPPNELEPPGSINGLARSAEVGGSNGATVNFGTGAPVIAPFITSKLEFPIQPGSVTITYKDATGVVKTITDDGDGNLTGDVDGTALAPYNTIDYDTGDLWFKTSVAVGNFTQAGGSGGSMPFATFRKAPEDVTTQDALTGGTDGAAITRNELTDPTLLPDREGMYALLKTNEIINLVVPDAAGNVTMSLDQTTECERNKLWFAILATPSGYNPTQAKDYRINKLGYTGSYAALYYPWIRITDPLTDLPKNVPPLGHIAGVYARTDVTKNVGKAPAGVVDGALQFCVGLERTLEFGEIDILHPNQVNCLIDTPWTGRCVWGARSLERPPSDFRYLQTRRLFIFLAQSIFQGTHGFVFEDIGDDLRTNIRMSVEGFLLGLYSQGYFKGKSPQEAFAVVCDETNNPPAVEDTGTVICDIYVAPNKPGEFIVFRLQQKAAQAG